MYSYEIDNFLKNSRYILSLKEYNQIVDTSPQINHIKYEQSFEFYFKHLLETNDNYSWFVYVLNYNIDDSRKIEVKY